MFLSCHLLKASQMAPCCFTWQVQPSRNDLGVMVDVKTFCEKLFAFPMIIREDPPQANKSASLCSIELYEVSHLFLISKKTFFLTTIAVLECAEPHFAHSLVTDYIYSSEKEQKMSCNQSKLYSETLEICQHSRWCTFFLLLKKKKKWREFYQYHSLKWKFQIM